MRERPAIVEVHVTEVEQVKLVNQLRYLNGDAFETAIALAKVAQEANRVDLHARKGFASPQEFYESLNIRWRTLHRALTVLEAIQRWRTTEEQDNIFALLVEVGIHKAAILAPVLDPVGKGKSGPVAMIRWAETASEEAVQERVTELRDRKPRKDRLDPGERLLSAILGHVPVERREQAEAVLDGMQKVYETGPVGAMLLLIDLGQQDLAAHGKWDEPEGHEDAAEK